MWWLGLTVMIGMLSTAPVSAQRMYRWVDEAGNVHFSDKIPPEAAGQRREALNKEGRVVGVVEAAKTREQFELEQRLELLRKEQEKIIAEQKSRDRVLLSTFRNEDDMRMTLQGKLQAIDAQLRVAQGNLLRLQKQLDAQFKEAASYELKDKKVPQPVLDEIAKTKAQIEQAQREIDNHLSKKQQVNDEFEADIKRFIFLTQAKTNAERISDEEAELKAADVLGLFVCENSEQCTRAWEVARRFVTQHSTTTVYVDTDRLIMSSDPITERDLSLSVSRQDQQNGKMQIFLDIRCHKSVLGADLCKSDQVKALRSSFRGYIEQELSK